MEWGLIKDMMKLFGFPDSFARLIMCCISTTKANVLFNGGELPQFTPTRGLGQCDPISPYLFILGMEVLYCLIEFESYKDNWEGITLLGDSLTLTHLLFMDDIILLGHVMRRP